MQPAPALGRLPGPGAPSPAALSAFFTAWRDELDEARKWLTAVRHYTMARLAAEVGLRLRAGRCALRARTAGQDPRSPWEGGSRGSGPRERLVPMLGDARPLLVWWVREIRGEFRDEWDLPRAALFPSERGGPITGDTFAAALGQAAERHLRGPVSKLSPHVLRHACASRLYGDGLSLAAIQTLLGHRWGATTLRYIHVAGETIETEYQRAAERSALRFKRA